ncbi:MAG TPA: glycine--tRNA ligase subunit beta [Smithellaceae bacterium]|jgi:glycyl-tRNA synthetase beta chain|nr:glycine--tRNA ligase subunit beta [Syntrophaceae bacterium]HNV56468.1 glycine--tRNA ligase subunit beta [Smithellaceae bacterium]HOD64568.1 glycine--tRNA ligase subunit beta [Smithellaceae bacterium]HOU55926.1 glycine--tRNA ligase subunit beta [Smithellaceae bacterium]HPV71706.1 glycine--tRNA ligase subunit beta [Smithellaceae bacterium]
MSNELLFEIGTEEIPAGFLSKAVVDMEEMIRKALSEKRIAFEGIRCLATPRRLALHIADLAPKQDDQVVEKMGPAKKAAFDENGQPTKAALGFARGQGLEVSQLETVTTDKGEYLCARKTIAGQPTADLLPDLLKSFLLAIPFRKSMRWAAYDLRFARPIHWLLALYGGKVVPLKVEDIESGNTSRGHRFMSPEAFAVEGYEDYLAKAQERFVIADPALRKKLILEEAQKSAADVGGKLFYTEDLLETITFIVEYPVIVRGGFDPHYLQIPKDVLTTTMISHQKYFPIVDDAGKLLPYFVAVSNTRARDLEVVARGNERVLQARLADASFFFEEDKKVPLEDRVESLKKVVFHTLLGTSHKKVMRFRKLAVKIAAKVKPAVKKNVDRAALLAKADLESLMVGEFSELQGIMGREYALLAGEKQEIADAIYEHYLPIVAGGDLPGTDEGAIVGIADKMDTIVGFFAVGMPPSGTADPYALRRQALGVINIILSRRYDLSLNFLIDECLASLKDVLRKPAEDVKKDVLEFFRGRLQNQLISQGYAYDTVDAVLAADIDRLVLVIEKIQALQAFRANPEFEPLSIAFKRIDNILKDFHGGSVDVNLLSQEAEIKLFANFENIGTRVEKGIAEKDFTAALNKLAALRSPVDAFFDSVMVMDKDEKIRFNRLSLLADISALFHQIADFSKIVTAG